MSNIKTYMVDKFDNKYKLTESSFQHIKDKHNKFKSSDVNKCLKNPIIVFNDINSEDGENTIIYIDKKYKVVIKDNVIVTTFRVNNYKRHLKNLGELITNNDIIYIHKGYVGLIKRHFKKKDY